MGLIVSSCQFTDVILTALIFPRWCSFHKQEHVEMAVRKSLSDLGLDYLDLYLVHFPLSLKFVPIEERYPSGWVTKGDSTIWEKVPLSETWKAMENLVDKKLVKHIGLSNFDLQLLQDLLTYCRIRPIVNQVNPISDILSFHCI